MYGNIHDTKVELIKKEIENLLNILNCNTINSEIILKKNTPELYKTSPTLFKFIIKNYNKISITTMNKNIDMMLKLITDIQKSKISQHDASVVVGKNLGEQFVPQLCKLPVENKK